MGNLRTPDEIFIFVLFNLFFVNNLTISKHICTKTNIPSLLCGGYNLKGHTDMPGRRTVIEGFVNFEFRDIFFGCADRLGP